jgi:DNA-directed RNA polymerase sigma subunit (sigma70/sigma32)
MTAAAASPLAKVDRNRAILRRRAAGASLKQLAEEFGISRERVRQVLWREEQGKGAAHAGSG